MDNRPSDVSRTVRTGWSLIGTIECLTPKAAQSSAVTSDRVRPWDNNCVRRMCVAKSRSPRLNQVSAPYLRSISRAPKVSPSKPHPVAGLESPERVYIMVSRSGDTRRPWNSSSSPVLTATTNSSGGRQWARPTTSLAPPTPPARASTRMEFGLTQRERGGRRVFVVFFCALCGLCV